MNVPSPVGSDSSQRGRAWRVFHQLTSYLLSGLAPKSHKAFALHPSISCCLCWAQGGILLSTACAFFNL